MLPYWLSCAFAFGRSSNSWGDLGVYFFVFWSPLNFILSIVALRGPQRKYPWFQITPSFAITNPTSEAQPVGSEFRMGFLGASGLDPFISLRG
jgi:hypothetical protein